MRVLLAIKLFIQTSLNWKSACLHPLLILFHKETTRLLSEYSFLIILHYVLLKYFKVWVRKNKIITALPQKNVFTINRKLNHFNPQFLIAD